MHDTALEVATCIFLAVFRPRFKHGGHTHSHSHLADILAQCTALFYTTGDRRQKNNLFPNHLRFCFNSRVSWFWRRIVYDRHWRDGLGECWFLVRMLGARRAGHVRADTGHVFWASIGIVGGQSERQAHDSCLWFGKGHDGFRSGTRVEP